MKWGLPEPRKRSLPPLSLSSPLPSKASKHTKPTVFQEASPGKMKETEKDSFVRKKKVEILTTTINSDLFNSLIGGSLYEPNSWHES